MLHFTTGIWSQGDPPKLTPPDIKGKAEETGKDDAKKEAKADAKADDAKKEEAKKDPTPEEIQKAVAEKRKNAKPDVTGANTRDIGFKNENITKASEGEPTPKESAAGMSDLVDAVGGIKTAVNMFWTLFTGFLVMFMQAGFALVETGLGRSKHAAHTMAMNFMIYALGMLGFYFVGFAFMFGGVGAGDSGFAYWGNDAYLLTEMTTIKVFGKDFGILGGSGFMLSGKALDASIMALFLFQMVFMDTTCTIPTGSMCERWKFISFVIYGFVISTLIYPVYGCWVWGGGWLSTLGTNFGLGHGHVDFAGSSVVHMTGGVCAAVGCAMIGARLGKYGKDGSVHVLPAHSVPMYMTGTFILAFGWFGFNPGSALYATDGIIARCAVTTMLASAAGAFTSMCYMWLVYGKPDPSFMCNGMLAGLVAITAPCAFVTPLSAVVIGAVAGVLVIWSCLFWERVAKLDDPVGAISVHGVNGAWGILSVGLFADGAYGTTWNGTFWGKNAQNVYQMFDTEAARTAAGFEAVGVTGLFYGSTGQLTASLIGIATNIVYVGLTSLIMFGLIKMIVGLRVSPEAEIQGLDIPEMGVLGYINDDPKTPEGHLFSAGSEPKPSITPSDGKKRFTVVVEGMPADKIATIWGDLCKPGKDVMPDFVAIYPKMTTLQGTHFKFLDGNPQTVSGQLAKILQAKSGGAVKTRVET